MYIKFTYLWRLSGLSYVWERGSKSSGRDGWVREGFRKEAVITLNLEGSMGLVEFKHIQNVYKNEQSHGSGSGLESRFLGIFIR